ncbi:MAG: choice-of-anchor D domain-containing protein [Proteobacteria bacterium]|nr:choice-of-anchor D domain-containing protein [Pseudomonadota bacterium]
MRRIFCILVFIPWFFGIAQADSDISVYPVAHVFEKVSPGGSSEPMSFSISNDGATDLSIGSILLSGTNADAFAVQNDTCTDQVVIPSGSCALELVFSPSTNGGKFATLLIPSNDPDTPTLNAALTNYESIEEESGRRIPPVLVSLDIPEAMTSGVQYTLTWSVLGYRDGYKSVVAFFNCDGQSDCGASYTDASRFEDSGKQSPLSMEAGSWQYAGVGSTRFNFSYTFTAPPVGQTTDIVIRFYQVSIDDEEAGGTSLSLLIPGNLTGSYYDTSGRRILKTIVP